jgi:hypothetical protein
VAGPSLLVPYSPAFDIHNSTTFLLLLPNGLRVTVEPPAVFGFRMVASIQYCSSGSFPSSVSESNRVNATASISFMDLTVNDTSVFNLTSALRTASAYMTTDLRCFHLACIAEFGASLRFRALSMQMSLGMTNHRRSSEAHQVSFPTRASKLFRCIYITQPQTALKD